MLTLIAPVNGQAQTPPVEAVCVGLGGEAFGMAIRTAAEIATLEARTGQPVPRVHPTTGECVDPAGLALLDSRGDPAWWRWDCVRDDTGWRGPGWSLTLYIRPDQTRVPVSPETGDCPSPRAANQAAPTVSRNAAAAAVYISQLEATGETATLYAWLHPDAQALISEAALAGWYGAEWLPRPPGPLLVDDVRFGGWTWPVTGAYYPLTATVRYHQAFDDGTVETGSVHLARIETGAWRWFFGGSMQFIDGVNATYGP